MSKLLLEEEGKNHKGHYRILLKPGASGQAARKVGARVMGAINGIGEVVIVRDGEIRMNLGLIETKCNGKSFVLGQDNISCILSAGTTLWQNHYDKKKVAKCDCQATNTSCTKKACCV